MPDEKGHKVRGIKDMAGGHNPEDMFKTGADIIAKAYHTVTHDPKLVKFAEESNKFAAEEVAKIPFLGVGLIKVQEVIACSELAQSVNGPLGAAPCRALKSVLAR